MTQDLIERLERAVTSGIIMEREAIELRRTLGLEYDTENDWNRCCWNALRGSVDSALALVVIDSSDPCGLPLAQVVAQTPALAICIALSRAHCEGEER